MQKKMFSNETLYDFLKESKIADFNVIQQQVIPLFLQGKSLNVIAKTGSGKTLAFLLPIVELLKNLEFNEGVRYNKEGQARPYAIILAPTRELATQITKVCKSITHHAKLKVRPLLGGVGTSTKKLAHEHIDILIATPGRLTSAIKRKEIYPSDVRYLVLDEADQVLEFGFKRDIQFIYEQLNKELLKVYLFSATSSQALETVQSEVFTDVPFINVNHAEQNQVARTLRTFNIFIRNEEKLKMMSAFIKNEGKGNGIIFVNKHTTIESVAAQLRKDFPKLKVHTLYGEMPAKDRKKSYELFLSTGGVLVATDIVARGVDIADLRWVLNFDLPFEAVYYVHRCGRVGRNSKDGFVYNLVCPQDSSIVSRINAAISAQTALKLSLVDEKRFKVQKRSEVKEKEETLLDKKKKKLADLKEKIDLKNKKKARATPLKHVKKVVQVSQKPRYAKKVKKK